MIEATAAREVGVPALPPDAVPAGAPPPREFKPFGAHGLSFWDLIDVVNPLQHIPIISALYRRLTGDEISPVARIAGATLFGGPIGAAVAVLDTAFEHKTGRDIGATALAMLMPEDKDTQPADSQIALAAKTSAATPVNSFAPRVGDPIQLVPAYAAPAVPDLQALATFATAAGERAPIGEPIRLEPRYALDAPAADQPQPSEATRVASARTARAQTWAPPAHDLPKGAARGLSRQAAMRAYTANAGAGVVPTPSTTAAQTLERETAEGRNASMVDAMMRALDKYEASHRLGSASAEPAQAVWR